MAVAWSILCVDFLPSNDGPQHAFAGYVKGHFRDSGAGWADRYDVNDPLTSNGYMDLLVPLESIVGLNTAHQVVVTAIVLLWAFGWFFWLRGELGAGSFLGLVAFPCSLQWCLWIGLYPFFFSSALIPFVLLIRRRFGIGIWSGMGLAVMLVGVARVHIFGAALCGLILVALSALEPRPRRAFVLTVLVGLPSFAYVLLVTASSKMLARSGTSWDLPLSPLDLLFEFFLPGPVLMQAAFLVVVLAAVATGSRSTPRRRLLLGVGLVILSVGLVLPIDWSGWELIRPRVLPTAFMLILGSMVVPRRIGLAVCVAACAFAGWRAAWAGSLHRHAAAELQPVVDAVRAVTLDDEVWTYVVTHGPASHTYDDIQFAGSFLHVAQMVAPVVGGAPFFAHDGDPSMHHILTRRHLGSPWMGSLRKPDYVRGSWDSSANRRMRDLHLSTYFATLSFLDAVVVYGLPGDGETLREAGYRVEERASDATGHSVFVGTFEGCAWNLQIDGLKEPTVVVIGFGLAPEKQDAWIVDISGSLRIEGVPCGPAWFGVEAGCVEELQNGQVPIRPTDVVQDLRCRVPAEAPADAMSEDVPPSEAP